MWLNVEFILLSIQVSGVFPTTSTTVKPPTASPLNGTMTGTTKSINFTNQRLTTMLPVPKETLPNKTKYLDNFYCPFGAIYIPRKACDKQTDCQTKMNLNAYCSEKEICCQEKPHEYDSLCYDRRLPLFGEQSCNESLKCDNRGALCKSKHCCPNFYYTPNEPLRPPSHFYSSNFPCTPGRPIPPGFQFAFCSNISRTIAYLGIVDKCGHIQYISKYSKCQVDSDCFPGGICVWIVDEGMCFRNPETCSRRTPYIVAFVSCFIAFVMMLFYFLAKACYEHPVKISNLFPKFALQLYSTTKDAEYEAYELFVEERMTQSNIAEIVRNAAIAAWEDNEKSTKKPATEYILNWFGYVVDYSEEESEEEEGDEDVENEN